MDDITIQITRVLEEYAEEVRDEIEDVLDDVGKEAVAMLKKTSPKRTGKYAKGWRVKKEKHGGRVVLTLYNAKYGSLTHLLENGHRKRNRTGWVEAQPHIAKVEKYAIKEAERRITEVLKG